MMRRAIRRRLVLLAAVGWITYKATMEDVTKGDWYIISVILVLEAFLPIYWWTRTRWQLWRTFDLKVIKSIREQQNVRVYVRVIIRHATELATFKGRCTQDKSGGKSYPD